MKSIKIKDREMTSEEFQKMKRGFDEHTIEQGVEVQKADRFTIVAESEGEFIGTASGLAYKNGDDYSGWFYLTDLFLEKEYRRQGLGAQLLSGIESKLKEHHIQNIWTWTAGYEAPGFYKKQGYHVFAEMKNWYSDGHSRIGLMKKL